MRTINELIVHCADTPAGMDIGADEIRRWHTDPEPAGNGWSDIGYHYVIRRNGEVEVGRAVEIVGAHCRGSNFNSLGVCLVGGRGETGGADFNFTRAQMDSLETLYADLQDWFAGIKITGHRDHAGKPCPSFNVTEYFK